MTLAEIEKQAILSALENNEFNRMKTARILGISVRTMRNKLREYGNHGVIIPFMQCGRPQKRLS
jgi:DNA-binding NtrC family response regulator